jgi:membrane protein implicated in regulation of membrane protease activity
MRLQLEEHLLAATAEGRTVQAVVGADLADFAEGWAMEFRRRPGVSWEDVASGKAKRQRQIRRELFAYIAGITLVVAAVAIAARGGGEVDEETWRWLWTGLAVVMAIGEIFTAGFFLLPFAIGAGAAAVLAWLGIAILPQWLVFFGVSMVALVYLRRFISHQDAGDQPQVGANRWINARGLALVTIDPVAATGMVRIGGEEWRATTDGHPIEAGTQVIVREVRGARLVVTPLEET